MQRKKPEVDVIMDILKATGVAYPESEFIKSLTFQYQERGGLSKKQLQGLYGKASKVKSIAPHKLATLEAVILKKPMKYKSDLPENTPLYTKDETAGTLIHAILTKYPQHKRVLFLKARYDNNETITPAEITELEKFNKLLK
ncbi:MAG: hypothetical protein HYR66_10625 [Sphingobacteriales bacterium]|nr:hypothetical protein [Sphingobacteriales bacterium]MBI3718731.1 hypothetical protein [Sphingobacteriales bacterium]